jgi:hypothetical protein
MIRQIDPRCCTGAKFQEALEDMPRTATYFQYTKTGDAHAGFPE